MGEQLRRRARPKPEAEGGIVEDLMQAGGRWVWALVMSLKELIAIVLVLVMVVVSGVVPWMVATLVVAIMSGGVLAASLLGALPLGRWWALVQSRYHRVRLRQRWPDIAVQLGWDHGFGDQRRRIPDLLQVNRSEFVLHVEVRPLAQHRRESWGVMCDQLRRYVGAPVARWEESRPGVLAIFLARYPLPMSVIFPPASMVARQWDRLRLGVRAGGDEVAWCPGDIPHLLIGGVTKGGKGSAMRNIAYDALTAGWQLVVINPKLSGEFVWLERLGVPVLEQLHEVLEVCERFELERVQRQAVVKASGVGSWDRVQGWTAPPLMLMVDEASTLLMVDKANKDIGKVQERLSYLLTRLVQLGRSAGIHVVLTTQRPDIAMLGPNGGILRDNIDGRIGVCSVQDEGLRMLFGSSLDPDVKEVLNGIKGRALATMLSAGDSDIYGMQLYYLDEAELLHTPFRPAVPQGLGLPLLSRGVA